MISVLTKIFFWTYPRGSWQYDLICVVILAFIFLTPRSILDGSAFNRLDKTNGVIEDQQAQ